jgi:L-methionine (R)-S-oxide reductase
MASRADRDYALLSKAALPLASLGREEAASLLVDLLWENLGGTDVSWLGFYAPSADGESLVLVCCKPRPACSPIGLHGVCGRAWRERRRQVVADVHALGKDHIVCDPANLSEVVVPCLASDGSCWGVLDLDSRSLGAFTVEDAEGLRRVLAAAGLTAGR